ncbi:MAG: DUF4810 domain-containing protein [Methylotenera sp.]|jgi:hypothetical protein|nr:DUF4810 domain-containing protein [Methylotenera sp.]
MNHLKPLALLTALVLVGCAQPGPKPLYQWEGYQPALYDYLKTNGNEPGAQISTLEAQLAKNQATGAASPPGMRAHLALLYSKMGDDAAAQRLLEAERAQFPESASYVDFLLKNTRKPASSGGNNAAPAAASAASQPRT